MSKLLIFISVFGAFAALACTQPGNKKAAVAAPAMPPASYDLGRPQRFDMPDKLLEISGIAFNNGNPDMVYAEQDEAGKVYYFKPGDRDIKHTEFAKPGDFEDIAIAGSNVVMLRSDGKLYTFPLSEVGKPTASGVIETKNSIPPGEYEGMFFENGKLYILTKHLASGKQTKVCKGYILSNNAGQWQSNGEFAIDVKQIEQQSGGEKMDFRPSALARHPKTKDWYVLSSINKMLVVTDSNWQVKSVYSLNNGLFLQPEGIAFDRDNNLYISNEGDKVTPGNILKFKYQAAVKAH